MTTVRPGQLRRDGQGFLYITLDPWEYGSFRWYIYYSDPQLVGLVNCVTQRIERDRLISDCPEAE